MGRKYLKWGMMVICCLVLQMTGLAQTSSTYKKEIADWDAKRRKSLTAESGWFNLAGLYWLDKGKNTFGSSKENKLVFPEGTIDAKAGYFEWSGNTVKMVAAENVPVLVNGQPSAEAIIFHLDSVGRNPVVLTYKNLKWTVIRREDKIGIRLRDLKSEMLTRFKGIERFPADTNWRLPAVLSKNLLQSSIPITNVLGQTTYQVSPGKLIFTIDKKQYSLDALDEGEEDLFIIFGDGTSGVSTYASGRFLAVKRPGPDGKTVIDFNKSYNPPCAFTPYATCPIPPSQNQLSVAITAGEKNYEVH
ncbi:MAG: DUF1684 domain-containing protein [Bacteroidota bacterium]